MKNMYASVPVQNDFSVNLSTTARMHVSKVHTRRVIYAILITTHEIRFLKRSTSLTFSDRYYGQKGWKFESKFYVYFQQCITVMVIFYDEAINTIESGILQNNNDNFMRSDKLI